MRSLGIGVLAVFLLAGTGAADTYSIDTVHSSVGFTIRHIFSRVGGSFTDFSGTIMYDPNHPETSSVEATIKVASINTNNERRDNHLRSADFFDAEKYPQITFKSTGAKKQDEKLMVTGDLTMHGVTRRAVLPIEVLGVGTHPMSKAPVAGFAAELTVKRSDFGVNNWVDKAGMLGDEIKVSLNIEAAGMKTAENPGGK
jgi:polyisoprenoid-binding protein YceI